MICDDRASVENRRRRAIITGIRGQDACLLGRLLQSAGWEVLGIDRQGYPEEGTVFRVFSLDLGNSQETERLVADYQPDCIFHLAAAHHSSEQNGDLSLDCEMVRTNFNVAEVLLRAITRRCRHARLLLAGSSQMYQPCGSGVNVIDETTPCAPSTFYGHTKAWSRSLLDHYRRQRGVFGSMVILFNHESPLRAPNFLARKVTMAAARAFMGQPTALRLRNVGAAIDFSSAEDVVQGMHLALAAKEPTDYVLASGRATRIDELLDLAFGVVGLDWRAHTQIEDRSKSNLPTLVGDATQARKVLGWKIRETLPELILRMVSHDVKLLGGLLPQRN